MDHHQMSHIQMSQQMPMHMDPYGQQMPMHMDPYGQLPPQFLDNEMGIGMSHNQEFHSMQHSNQFSGYDDQEKFNGSLLYSNHNQHVQPTNGNIPPVSRTYSPIKKANSSKTYVDRMMRGELTEADNV